jgi:hypothetical protein
MNHFWWGSVFRLSLASLGRSRAPLKCQPPVGKCNLWEKAGVDPGHFMCKLLKQMRSLVGVSERVVQQVLYVGELVGFTHRREHI